MRTVVPHPRKRGERKSLAWFQRNSRITDSGCWEWQGMLNHGGYGILGGFLVHRQTFVIAKGSIPSDLQIDHLCRVRACCNPAHMEAVSAAENSRRAIRSPIVRMGNVDASCRGSVALAQWLIDANIKQVEAAKIFGCTQGFVSKLLAGTKTPGLLLGLHIGRMTDLAVSADLWTRKQVAA